jgi:hypothetical protein
MIFAVVQTKFPFLISCFPDYEIPAFSSNALIRLSRTIRFNQENWKNRKEKCPPRSFSAKKQ